MRGGEGRGEGGERGSFSLSLPPLQIPHVTVLTFSHSRIFHVLLMLDWYLGACYQ